MPQRRRLHHATPSCFDRFWFGACYYPEHWDAATRANDGARMAAAGINVVRMGEFAWDRFEPDPGSFDFAWLDAAIVELGRHGISTILGTPTASPPAWLIRAEPELRRIDADGRVQDHGSRQHACTTNPRYREHSRRITRALAEHYRDQPLVVGWQTDNEFHCHFSECHCDACQVGFREFLAGEYRDVAALNDAWGTSFWAQTYRDFSEIRTPRDGKPTYSNPGARLDYFRFLSHQTTLFQRDQVTILRAAGEGRFLFHNGMFGHLGYREDGFTTDLDVHGVDIYPMFIAPPDRMAWQLFICDRARSIDGNFIIPEQQMGPGGQNTYLLETPEPGEAAFLTWVSIARGADSLLYFRWRTCRFGSEEYWFGILDHDDVPRRRYDEVAEVGKALQRVGPVLLGTSVHVDVAVAAEDFIGTSAHKAMNLSLPEPQTLAGAIHREFSEAGFATGVIHPSDDLTGVKLYVIPSIAAADPAWVAPLQRWVEAGGTLVLTGRSGHHDRRNRCLAESRPGCWRDLAGVTVAEIGKRPPNPVRQIGLEVAAPYAASGDAGCWYETLEPHAGTTVVATWSGRHLDSVPAATVRQLGKGRVIYVGAIPTREVCQLLLPLFIGHSGVQRLWPQAPREVHVTLRSGQGRKLWFCFNTSDEPVTFVAPTGRDLLADRAVAGSLTLGRHGCAVILQG